MAGQAKGYLGYCALKKTAGQSTPAVGTQISFPVAAIHPRNPANIVYPRVANAAAAPSVRVAGKKTPSVALTGTPVKASWWTLNNVSDWIAAAASFLDTSGNSSEYAIGIHDGSSLRVYDGGKCSHLSLYQTAQDGPILMDMRWVCLYGDSEKGTPTSFGAVSTDAGNLLDVSQVDFTGTATDVFQWRLTVMRPQGYQSTCDSTLYMASVETGMLGGTLRLAQNALAATVPTTACTVKVGQTGAGIQLALNLSRDEKQEEVIPSLLSQLNDYTLFNTTGAYPLTLTAM